MLRIASFLLTVLFVMTTAQAQIVIPGADGSDGDLIVDQQDHLMIDLSLAADGAWDSTPAVPGQGVYDADRWVVVYKYSSVDINLHASWRSVWFNNHPSRAPVVWLVSGDVTINSASIEVSGENGIGCSGFAEPGPGGFRGGRGWSADTLGSGGFGPAGGTVLFTDFQDGWSPGGYALQPDAYGIAEPPPAYGNVAILPLIGGSGGGTTYYSGNSCSGGGAGGGAIMIAAQGTITLNGHIYANGGNGNGSVRTGGAGGAIKLIADRVEGTAALHATGGSGWNSGSYSGSGTIGRLLVQCNEYYLTGSSSPTVEVFSPIDGDLLIWPPTGSPEIKPVSIELQNGTIIPIPDDPTANLTYPVSDVQFDTNDQVTVHIEATNVPLDWSVVIRVTPKTDSTYTILADPLTGTEAESTTSATFSLNRGFGTMQVTAYAPQAP